MESDLHQLKSCRQITQPPQTVLCVSTKMIPVYLNPCPVIESFLLGISSNLSKCCCLVAKSCLTLCNPMDCSPPGSSVHGISQVRILEWVAISFCEGSSRPRDPTRVCCIAGGSFTAEPPGKSLQKCWMFCRCSLCLLLC